ncbi:phage tail protein [Streptomyces sp. WZ.A104]|uniref:phage tail domain-containing protein n=1 Tax=Streptomyces sp. WZ.A104 TaxID=2023771 RepID=UPI000BBCF594|nr:phage tail domain-containing protein [Streptomyces sp. WZ.A104]PCG86352.1 phage tail protein [Streptomyces sp. WZ.A104]
MTQLRLETARDVLDLNGVADSGYGFQATAGLTGFGLPAVSAQWLEGAGDGARWRGQRVLSRDIDIPLDIVGHDRSHLRELVSRLARAVADEMSLVIIDDEEVRWSTAVYRIGGGDIDLAGTQHDVQTVITVRAADPYFTASTVSTQTVGGDQGAASLLSSLAAVPLAASQAIGEITLENSGDAPAYPVWEVHGPGSNLEVVSPTGEALTWNGRLLAGERLIVDTRQGTVTDHAGANRYTDVGTAPRFWTVPAGTTTATVRLLDTTAASKVVCSWRPRKWMVI